MIFSKADFTAENFLIVFYRLFLGYLFKTRKKIINFSKYLQQSHKVINCLQVWGLNKRSLIVCKCFKFFCFKSTDLQPKVIYLCFCLANRVVFIEKILLWQCIKYLMEWFWPFFSSALLVSDCAMKKQNFIKIVLVKIFHHFCKTLIARKAEVWRGGVFMWKVDI